MSIPILFMHRTDGDFLFYSLNQAKKSNPKSKVILMGTPLNQKYASSDIKHKMISDYNQSALKFEKVYRHLSPNSYEYNLFCFQRWFILKDFMLRKNFSECLMCDTDVMLYADINQREYPSLQFELTWMTLTSLRDLIEYCTMIENYFADPNLFENLKDYTIKTGNYIQTTGSLAISDMVTHFIYFDKYRKRNRLYGWDNDSYFDGNISHPLNPAVEMLDNKKKIYFINGGLYLKRVHTNDYITLNSLHFAGPPSKMFIKYFYQKNLPHKMKGNGVYFFDYLTSQWVPTSV